MTNEANLTENEVTRKFDTYRYDLETSRFRKFLWFCAGADIQLLQRSPHSERVMMEGIGGVVLATAVLAACSGGYAFYTVFGPKVGIGLDSNTQGAAPAILGALFFAAVWAAVIFNLDRFIVSSTGDGDGTDKITWREIGYAFPRLLMALFIGITIAAPLEIKIMESELTAKINEAQREKSEVLRAGVDKRFSEKLADLDRLIAVPQDELKGLQEAVTGASQLEDEARVKRDGELVGSGPTGKRGKGVQYDAMDASYQAAKAKAEAAKVELDQKKPELDKKIEELRVQRADIVAKRDLEYQQVDQQVRNLDGLATRISLAHHEYPWISGALTGLLLFIEVSPIFFKMMLTKGPYKYLIENQKHIVLAKWGIEAKKHHERPSSAIGSAAQATTDTGKGDRSPLEGGTVDRFHQPETLLNYQRGQLLVEQELTNLQLDKYRGEKTREITGGTA